MIAFEHVFSSRESQAELSRRLANYAQANGYEPDSRDSNTFRRGSLLKSLTTFDPRKLSAELRLVFLEDTEPELQKAQLKLNVSTTGQLVTNKDQEIWRAELAEVASFMSGGLPDPQKIVLLPQQQRISPRLSLLLTLCGGVFSGVILSAVTRDSSSFFVGLFLGGLVIGIVLRLITRKPARSPNQSGVPQPAAYPIASSQNLTDLMRRDIRGWGVWSIVVGGLALLSSQNLNPFWGTIQLLVGLISFIFYTPALYIIYGTMMVWAAVYNMLSGQATWLVFGFVQIGFAVRIFLQFRRYNRAYLNSNKASIGEIVANQAASEPECIPPDPKAVWLNWVSLVLGVAGSLAIIATIVVVIVLILNQDSKSWIGTEFTIIELSSSLCVVAFGAGLGSALSKNRHIVAAIVGMIAGGLGMILYIGLMILGNLG